MNASRDVAAIRKEYARASLTEAAVARDPVEQFRAWFEEALGAEVPEPTAMALATADASGRPSVRMVLLKEFDSRGFVFYTNYEGRKGTELAENPRCALLFYWGELERQVRIEGPSERVPAAESDAYFATRPRESQVSAWASPQSRTVADRETLEAEAARVRAHHEGEPIPRPPQWGGFRCLPEVIEFWQGRPNRLHDRIRYRRNGVRWERERIAP